MLLTQLEEALAQNASLQFLVRHLERLDIEVYLAGGAIRDLYCDRRPTDFDLVCRPLDTAHLLLALQSLPGKTDLSSASLGIFLYHDPAGTDFEIALPRLGRPPDLAYSEFAVAFSPHLPIQEDLLRRDFNVNAIAYDFAHHILLDPTGGLDSLRAGQFDALPSRSRHEDAVRVLRALVLCARHRLQPTPACLTILQQAASGLTALPSHRVRRELLRIFSETYPADALRLARTNGALKVLLPTLDAVYDFDQHNRHHHQALGEHSLAVLEIASADSTDLSLRLAALLHDIGKPACAHWVGTQMHFPDHALAGSKLAQDALQYWDLETALVDEVACLVADHMFEQPTSWRQMGLSRQTARRLLQLRLADEASKGQDLRVWQALLETLTGDSQSNEIREAFVSPTRHQPSRAHPWVEHRNRRRRGNWDERTPRKNQAGHVNTTSRTTKPLG